MAAQGKRPGAVEWWLEKASQTLGHSVARPNPCEPIEKAFRFVRVQCAVCSVQRRKKKSAPFRDRRSLFQPVRGPIGQISPMSFSRPLISVYLGE
jgi:hypothetical protein